MGVGYAAKADPEPENWKWILIPLLAGIGAGFLAGLYWHTRRVKGAFLKRVEYFAKKVMEDFRIAAVFVGLLVSIALTFYFARLATDESVKGFWTEFYAAWVAGLLFFAVVGLILGLVSLYRPERDVFAARVKILTGGKEGLACTRFG